jgi:hypothetical protein
MTTGKTCSRIGCGKQLRDSNSKGVCSSGCRSMEAPPAQRADELRDAAPKAKRTTAPTVATPADGKTELERFRIVAPALGHDAEALLEAFAHEWLDVIRGRLEAADE